MAKLILDDQKDFLWSLWLISGLFVVRSECVRHPSKMGLEALTSDLVLKQKRKILLQ